MRRTDRGGSGARRWAGVVPLALAALVLTQAAPAGATTLGTNLVGVTDFSGAIPFSNIMRQARSFCSQIRFGSFCNGGPMATDPEGFPTSLETNQIARTIVMSGSAQFPAGLYRARWDGTGTIAIPHGIAQVVSEGPGFTDFQITPNGNLFELTIESTDPADHLRRLRLMLPGVEDETPDTFFNPAYLDLLRPYTALRFMDWGGTNNSTVEDFASRPRVSDFTFARESGDNPAALGVPLEVMVDLANTLGADPWFNVPAHATDDYIRQMAVLIKDRLAPELTPRVEYSNETWNGIFTQADFVRTEGTERGLGNGDSFQAGLQFTALRAMQIWDIWDEVFGTRPYRRVLASQSANPDTGNSMLSFTPAGGTLSAGDRADEYAIAPYFTVDGLTDESRLDELSALTVDELLDLAAADAAGRIQNEMTGNLTMANGHDVDLVAYEGGQHLVAYPFDQADDTEDVRTKKELLSNKLIAANRASRMGTIYTSYLNQWHTTVGGLFNHFTDVTVPSRSGSWGSVESMLQDPATAFKRLALEQFATQITHTLTVTTSGAGTGTVTGRGIDCGGGVSHTDCSQIVAKGASVALTATPAAGSSFGGFSGGSCVGTSPCTVVMDADKSVNAAFATTTPPPATRTLTVSTSGTGSGIVTGAGIDCGGSRTDCSEVVSQGTVIQLTAAASSGSSFAGFSGAGCGASSPCAVTMDVDKSVSAAFTANAVPTRTLTVGTSGAGTGTVTGTGIDCGGVFHTDCSETVAEGSAITLTATPAAGSSFGGFSGGGCAATSPCTVVMDADKSVNAVFAVTTPPPATRTLTVSTSGSGIVTGAGIDCGGSRTDCSEVVSQGTVIQLTAAASSGSSFAGFSGAGCGASSPCAVTMDVDKSVSAAFTANAVPTATPAPTPTPAPPVATATPTPGPTPTGCPVARGEILGTRGNDTLPGTSCDELIRGLAGKDRIAGGDGDDIIDGGAGNDRIAGGNGADRITGGRGRDVLAGNAGNDRIAARDRTRDRITCGPGRDTVVADRNDRVARDCEVVGRR